LIQVFQEHLGNRRKKNVVGSNLVLVSSKPRCPSWFLHFIKMWKSI